MDFGQQIIIAAGVFLAGWYGVFFVLNRRRGIATYYWLREGVEAKIGEITNAGWIGSSASGAHFEVGKAEVPFKQLEILFLLESREILPLWIFNRLRGKRDELILKASLRASPKLEVEVAHKGGRHLKGLVSEGQKRPYEWISASGGFDIVRRGRKDSGMVERLMAFLDQHGAAVQQISLRRKMPNLVVRVSLSSIQDEPAGEFLAALQAWLCGEEASNQYEERGD